MTLYILNIGLLHIEKSLPKILKQNHWISLYVGTNQVLADSYNIVLLVQSNCGF